MAHLATGDAAWVARPKCVVLGRSHTLWGFLPRGVNAETAHLATGGAAWVARPK